MLDKPEVFAVIWVDTLVGPLSLHKSDAQSAIDSAKGADKVSHVRAVHVPAGKDILIDLI